MFFITLSTAAGILFPQNKKVISVSRHKFITLSCSLPHFSSQIAARKWLPKIAAPGTLLAAACRTGCIDIPRYLHSIIQRSLETSGMAGSWKASHVAGERGEKDDSETKEREGACELS